jgi:uncharacterized coiled-coil DUF342 family protein
MVMECATKDRIKNTVDEVRSTSFEEKINSSEEKINSFLDSILDFKGMLEEKTSKILKLADKLEEITWFTIDDNECLMLLNDLIAQSKDLHSTLIRNYTHFAALKTKGIAKEEIKEYKAAIDDFKESFTDLESVFFYLPEMPQFNETTRELSLL